MAKKYPTCPAGTIPFTRRKSKYKSKKELSNQVHGCKKETWLSDKSCANRDDNDVTVTGDKEMDDKINRAIDYVTDKSLDLCYRVIGTRVIGKDPKTGKNIEEKIYETDKSGNPVLEPSGLYFCRRNKQILRKDMPQMEGFDLDIGAIQDIGKRGMKPRLFLDSIIEQGVKIRDGYVEVCKLKSTQKELEGSKVREKLETLKNLEGKLDRFKTEELKPLKIEFEKKTKDELIQYYENNKKKQNLGDGLIDPSWDKDKIKNVLLKKLYDVYFGYLLEIVSPIIVSKDGYILDGHHRWAALLAWDFKDKLDKPIKIHVKIINLPIETILQKAHEFNKQYYASLKK